MNAGQNRTHHAPVTSYFLLPVGALWPKNELSCRGFELKLEWKRSTWRIGLLLFLGENVVSQEKV